MRRVFSWEPLSPESVLGWLASFDVGEQFYFSGKDGDYEFAGLGSALTITGVSPEDASNVLSGLWSRHPLALVFGGTAFNPDNPALEEWADFGGLRFTLPLVELRRDGQSMQIAFNFLSTQGLSAKESDKALIDLVEELEKTRTTPIHNKENTLCGDEQIPSRSGWNTMITRALEEIEHGAIDKVVLSRKRILTARNSWNALDILGKLASVRDDSFVFLYKIARDRAFVGRTPERLLRLEGRSISVDAIAGTRPRGRDAAEDKSLENELLDSPKELEEHRIVSRYVEEQIGKIARDLQTSPLESILKLKNLQHIFTQHCGTLRNGHSILDTLGCFHPTPAVGGYPAKTARDLILQWEPHQRGWYAGPIGWMTGQGAEFAVGIRSALVHGKQLHIFAGAGIVEHSDPDAEWRETEQKMQTIARVSEDAGQAGEC
ncbi:MAG: isochorismate synthase [Desulfatibacillum sp.]|nr:isochorismate synthase [Desulfatibacillum sp.]